MCGRWFTTSVGWRVRADRRRATIRLLILTIVLSELKLDSEQVPNNLSWHFLCTAVWHAKNIEIMNQEARREKEKKKKLKCERREIIKNIFFSAFLLLSSKQIINNKKLFLRCDGWVLSTAFWQMGDSTRRNWKIKTWNVKDEYWRAVSGEI